MADKESKNLNDLFYNFTVLYERWNEDKLAFAKQLIKLEQVTKDFTVRINDLEQTKNQVKKDIASSVYEAGVKVSTQITNEARIVIEKEITASTNKLHNIIEKNTNEIRTANNCITSATCGWGLSTLAATVLVGFAIGMLVLYLMMPTPSRPITGEELATYENGRHFETFWPKLSQEEKDRLNAISLGMSVPKYNPQGKRKAKVQKDTASDLGDSVE